VVVGEIQRFAGHRVQERLGEFHFLRDASDLAHDPYQLRYLASRLQAGGVGKMTHGH